MRAEQQSRWRIVRRGRWLITPYYVTEEQIRIDHPEAVLVPGTTVVRHIPETEEELRKEVSRIHHW